MIESNTKLPLIVSVTMYRNNLNDNRILSEIKKNSRIYPINGSNKNFFVSTNDLNKILDKFDDDITFQNSLSHEDLIENVNSSYFLSNILKTFDNLKYIKFTVSNSKNYSRGLGDMISFDYKITHAKIDFPALIESDDIIEDIQYLFQYFGFWEYDPIQKQTSIECTSQELVTKINVLEYSDPEMFEKYSEAINEILLVLDFKIESDNSILHFVLMK